MNNDLAILLESMLNNTKQCLEIIQSHQERLKSLESRVKDLEMMLTNHIHNKHMVKTFE